MAKAKAKEPTLRQQMRKSAESRLTVLMDQVRDAVANVLEDTTLDMDDVMAMCCKTQTGTLRDKLVGRLADEAERDIVKLWNNQQALDLESKDAN